MADEQSANATLHGLLMVVRRRLWVIVTCAVLVPAGVLALSLSQEKEYSASASLLFRDPGFDEKIFGSTVLAPSADPDREAATNEKLVSLDVVAQRTARTLGGSATAGSISSNVEVESEGNSNVVRLTATNPDPRRAALIANTFAEEYIAFRREADQSKIREALALVRSQLEDSSSSDTTELRRRSLSQEAERLEILVSLQTGNAELVQPASTPSSPSSPRPVRNSIIAGFFGLLLGLILATLFDRLDRRLKDPKEIEEVFERPILGAIPQSRALGKADSHPMTLPPGDAEAFRMLRANLRYFNVSHDIRSVLVTSAAPGDGKSTVAWYLAAAAAETGSTVLLMEADLRHPAFAKRFVRVTGMKGLSTILAGEASPGNVTYRIPLGTGTNSKGVAPASLDLMSAGPLPPNPTDLIESDAMIQVIREAESRYDLVVIDTPPTSVVSDAVPLLKQVSAVIVVSRIGRTTRDAATHLRNQLRNIDAPTLGVVVNGLGQRAAYGYGYGYAYGYGRGDRAEESEFPAPPRSAGGGEEPDREAAASTGASGRTAGERTITSRVRRALTRNGDSDRRER